MSETARANPPPSDLLEALRQAIYAMNNTPSFDTGLPNPERPGRTLTSYQLLPKLEAVAKKYAGPG